jgi:hypothetical protein
MRRLFFVLLRSNPPGGIVPFGNRQRLLLQRARDEVKLLDRFITYTPAGLFGRNVLPF